MNELGGAATDYFPAWSWILILEIHIIRPSPLPFTQILFHPFQLYCAAAMAI